MADRHKDRPKAVRMPGGLLPRVEAAVKGTAETVNSFIVAAIEERLTRRESGSTTRARMSSADTAPPAAFRPAGSHALNCKCGICKTRKNGDQ